MNCHVFTEKNGALRFVGDFDALYREESDPWHQSGEGPSAEYYRASRHTLVEALSRHATAHGLEIGCGHGHVAAYLQGRLGKRMTGMDIAPAAIMRAQELHTGPRFVVGDIASDKFEAPGKYGFVIWGQMLWYVLERFDKALVNTLRCIEPGGVFVVSQAFLKEQRYGREIANGWRGTLALCLGHPRLELIEARYDDSDYFEHRDGLLAFRVN